MRKYIFHSALLFINLSLFNTNTFAQKQGKALIDSLETKLKNYSSYCIKPCLRDSSKVNLLLGLAWEFNFNATEKVLPLCDEALKLSQKISFTIGVARSYHVIANFYNSQNDYPTAIKFFSDEISILDKLLINDGKTKFILSEKAACFNSMANIYKSQGNSNSAIYYFQSALKVNEKYKNEEPIAINNKNIGDLYIERGEFSKAISCYYDALRIYERLGKQNESAAIFGSLGRAYRRQGDLAKAQDFYSKAIIINEARDDKNGLGINYQSLGLLYRDQNNITKALEYYNKALELFLEMKNGKGIASINNNIGAMYQDEGDFNKKNKEIDSAKINYLSALSYFEKASEIQEKLGRNYLLETYLGNIGSIYLSLQQNAEGEQYLLQSLSLADSLEDFDGEYWCNGELSEFYSKNGNFAKALLYYKKTIIAKDSLFNETKTKEITRTEMNYQFDKKEALTKAEYEKQKALAEAEKKTALAEAENKSIIAEAEADKKTLVAENENQKMTQAMTQQKRNAEYERKDAQQKIKLANAEAQLQKQKVLRYSLIGGSAVLALASVFAFLFYKRNAEQKQKETSLNLQVSETEMKALRSQMNPHFIFNALQSIQTFLLTHQSEEANLYLLKFSKLMRAVLENSQHSEVPLKEDIQALELYMQLESIRLQHPFTYQFHIDESVDIENDNIPPLILQPFVENAIWHGLQYKPEPGHINIYISKKDNALYATVEDNGVGRDMSKQVAQPMLLKKESLGMKLTEERLKILNEVRKTNARFEIADLFTPQNTPIGTRVVLSLPLI